MSMDPGKQQQMLSDLELEMMTDLYTRCVYTKLHLLKLVTASMVLCH